MDQHSKTARRQLAGVCVKNLKNNGFAADYFETVPEALAFVQNLIPAGASVGFGGSETLKQTGILDWLYENKDYTVYDRYHTDDVKKVFHQCLMADYYLMSTNALTADGHLYNVDNTGNRVAALAYGPEHVVIIAGTNKIVRNDEAAVNRNEDVAAPANNIRLNMPNPCTEYGRCMHCSRDTTLCNQLVITRRSKPVERIHVILINEELGY
ncbi:MAG: lactate utilization protein [Solobacterium sp.]|nr:lactate utilization protein [Solobacterium sp.]